MTNIKQRLSILEDRLGTGEVLLIVGLPDGTEKEVRLDDFRDHCGEWDFKRVSQCASPAAAAEILDLWLRGMGVRSAID